QHDPRDQVRARAERGDADLFAFEVFQRADRGGDAHAVLIEAYVRSDDRDVGAACDRLQKRQGVAETDQQIDADQRLHAGGERVADRQLFDIDAVLLEQSRIDADVG